VFDLGVRLAKYGAFFSFFIGFSMNACMAGIIYYGAVLNSEG